VARANKKPKPEFDVVIEGFSHDGRGVGRVDGKAVFVSGALVGERVRAQLIAKNKHFDEAKTLEIIIPSVDRVEPRCPHFGLCSGCVLQHMSAEKQIEAKQTTLLDNLQRIGHVQPEHILPVLTADAWGYRRKGRFSVRHVEKKGGVLVGFREIDPRFVADLKHCDTLIPELSQLIVPLANLINSMQAKQEIRQIEFIAGNGPIALVFRNFITLPESDLALLREFELGNQLQIYLQPGDIHTVYPLNANPEPLSFNLDSHDIKFQFQPLDFIQVNAKINEAMIDQTLDLLQPSADDVILDLFCGLGNFTLPLAKLAGEVVGVEGDQKLVDRAKNNAESNNINNAHFFAADLNQDISSQLWKTQRFNKILLDPPRNGALEVLKQLNLKGVDKIVYVSCHPASLARDAGYLVNERGYRLVKAGAMDMFPQTAHVESIAVFEAN
jgi:23S rRNA (uracil1939-C5)-methyltransferase